MSNSTRRNLIIIVLLALLALIVLLLFRCKRQAPVADQRPVAPAPSAAVAPPAAPTPAAKEPDEVLTPATLQAPTQVVAGSELSVSWTGPDNKGDYVTIVRKDAPAGANGNYRVTREGRTLKLIAPIEPGECEVRYVTGRSSTILGRAPVTVAPITATLDAAAEATLGTQLAIKWTGPNNAGDFITIVKKSAADGQYANYTYTKPGSPITVLVPIEPGDAEIRYMTGQGNKVLARRPLAIVAAEVSLSAAAEVIAGSTLSVTWAGPNNSGDFITIAAKDRPDGQYGNYTYTKSGSPLTVLVPITTGEVELRYMTGQGNKVLARRPLTVVAAEVSLAAPAEAIAGSNLTVTWTGPKNPGDFIAIAPKEKPDGQYVNYAYVAKGSPLPVLVPIMTGDAELRYMTGQGNKVLARRPVTIVAAEISLSAPADVAAGSAVTITWTGPGNPGDFIALVPAGKPDNQFGNYAYTNKGSPLKVLAPKEPGEAEVRYLAGQGNKVLARRPIRITR